MGNPMYANISPEICLGVFFIGAVLFAAVYPLSLLYRYLDKNHSHIVKELSDTKSVIESELETIKNGRFFHGL